MTKCIDYICGELKKNEGMLIDLEEEQIEQQIRAAFTRKVYGLLGSQFLVNFAFILWFSLVPGTNYFVLTHLFIYYIMIAICIVLLLIIFFFSRMRREKPKNFLLLGAYTLAKSYTVAVYASIFPPVEMFVGIALSIALCIGLTIYAAKTSTDFTKRRYLTLYLFFAILFIIIFGPSSHSFVIVKIIFAVFAILVFSVWVVYHTQFVIGQSNRKYCFCAEEYIFGVLVLYLDMTSILYNVLVLFGGQVSVVLILFSSVTMRESGPKKNEPKPAETAQP